MINTDIPVQNTNRIVKYYRAINDTHANIPPQLPLQYPFKNIALPENTSHSIYQIVTQIKTKWFLLAVFLHLKKYIFF